MKLKTLLLTVALVSLSLPAQALSLGARIGGGTVLAWDDIQRAGNAFGLAFTVDHGPFQGAAAFGTVLPDSRVDGRFDAWWLEGQWHPFRPSEDRRCGAGADCGMLSLSPHLILGVGLVTADGPPADPVVAPVRWVTQGPQVLGVGGIGVTYGNLKGLSISLDFRAYNHTHGGLSLHGMWRF